MEKKFIIGIDISKDRLDVCLLEHGATAPVEERALCNDTGAVSAYLRDLAHRYGKGALTACMEHTGHYGLAACVALEQAGVAYAVVPAMEIKKTQGMARGKSDRADARRIAVYAWRYADRLRAHSLPDRTLSMARELASLRALYVRMGVQLRNALHAHRAVASVTGDTAVTDSMEAQLGSLESETAAIERRLAALMENCEGVRENYALLKSVKGIGPLTATALILTTGNFRAITDGRRFNSYAGLAPFPHESGNMRRPARTSPMANKRVKTLLHNGAASAIVHDNELRMYYKRKTGQGKHRLCVLNAVACKLVYRAFAVIKRQTPYVNLYQNIVA